MQKPLFYVVLFVVLCAAVAIGLRNFVMTSGVCTLCKTLYTLLAPPPDYYEPLANARARQEGAGQYVARIEFAPRYHGAHMLALSSARTVLHVSEIAFSVECTSEGVAITRSSKLALSDLFTEGEGGYSVFVFRVPEDIHLNSSVVCDVNIAAEDDRLDLRVVKLSDI